jgi:hypothetical protein
VAKLLLIFWNMFLPSSYTLSKTLSIITPLCCPAETQIQTYTIRTRCVVFAGILFLQIISIQYITFIVTHSHTHTHCILYSLFCIHNTFFAQFLHYFFNICSYISIDETFYRIIGKKKTIRLSYNAQ